MEKKDVIPSSTKKLNFNSCPGGRFVSGPFPILVCRDDNKYELYKDLEEIISSLGQVKVIVVYGRVGSGKSSLLNLLLGMTVFVAGHDASSQTKGIQACIVQEKDGQTILYMDCEGVGSLDERDKLILLFATFTQSIFIYNIKNKFEGSARELTDDMKIATLISKELAIRGQAQVRAVKRLNILLRDYYGDPKKFGTILSEMKSRNPPIQELCSSFHIDFHFLPFPCKGSPNRNLAETNLNEEFKSSVTDLQNEITSQISKLDSVSGPDLYRLWINLISLNNSDGATFKKSGVALLIKEFVRSERNKLERDFEKTMSEIKLPIGVSDFFKFKDKSLNKAKIAFDSINEPKELISYNDWIDRKLRKLAAQNLDKYMREGASRITDLINQYYISNLRELDSVWKELMGCVEKNIKLTFDSEVLYRKYVDDISEIILERLTNLCIERIGEAYKNESNLVAFTVAKQGNFKFNVDPFVPPTKPQMRTEVPFDPKSVGQTEIQEFYVKRRRFGKSKHKEAHRVVEDGVVIGESMGKPTNEQRRLISEKNQRKLKEAENAVKDTNERIREENNANMEKYIQEKEKREQEYEKALQKAREAEILHEIGYSFLSHIRQSTIYLLVNFDKIPPNQRFSLILDKWTAPNVAISYFVPRIISYVSRIIEASLLPFGGIQVFLVVKVTSFIVQVLLNAIISKLTSECKGEKSDFKSLVYSSFSFGMTSNVISKVASQFIPYQFVIDCVVDVSQALMSRYQLQEKVISQIIRSKSEPSGPKFEDLDDEVDLDPKECYKSRMIKLRLRNMAWPNSKTDNMNCCLAFSLYKIGKTMIDYSQSDEQIQMFKSNVVNWVKSNTEFKINDGDRDIPLKERYPDLEKQNEMYLSKNNLIVPPLYLWAIAELFNSPPKNVDNPNNSDKNNNNNNSNNNNNNNNNNDNNNNNNNNNNDNNNDNHHHNDSRHNSSLGVNDDNSKSNNNSESKEDFKLKVSNAKNLLKNFEDRINTENSQTLEDWKRDQIPRLKAEWMSIKEVNPEIEELNSIIERIESLEARIIIKLDKLYDEEETYEPNKYDII